MCGIVGYVGKREAGPILLECLRRLEYRGYDSVGAASVSDEGKLIVRKGVGGVQEVEDKLGLSMVPGHIGIGHVRWATHGAVTSENAHPHVDCTGHIAVVHNGIIENHQKLRSELSVSHRIVSDTDTELIAHLIEDELGHSLPFAVERAVRRLEGAFSFAVISARHPNVIVAVRRRSPLVVGIADHGYFVASDPLTFAGYCHSAVLLEEDDLVILKPLEMAVFGPTGLDVSESRMKVPITDVPIADLPENVPSHMMKEIQEQPVTIRATVAAQSDDYLVETAMDILRARNVVFTACGSSRFAAMVGRYLFSTVGDKFTEVVVASEHEHLMDSIGQRDMVIALSQSGETADVLNAVRACKHRGATIVSILNRDHSSLENLSDRIFRLTCGPEVGVAATKSFTAQVAILTLLGYAMRNRARWAQACIGNTIGREVLEVLTVNQDTYRPIVDAIAATGVAYFIGHGVSFPIACEGALKMKEMGCIPTEGLPAGELKHGSLALVENGTPVIAICLGDEDRSFIAEVKARGAYVIGVSPIGDAAFDEWILVSPTNPTMLWPILAVIPLHMLAHDVALARGHNPDRPRNLAKSVTVT